MTTMSLARRVCADDDTLHFSTFHKDLYKNLLVYTEGRGVTHMGAILCFVVTLCWFLHVSEELTSCLSFSRALLALKRGRTHILVRRVASGVTQFDFESISSTRLVLMLVMNLVRALIACWLFVSGAMWLATTRNVEDLVLNAVSLIFVFETDELLYKTLAPTQVRTLVRVMNPLKKPVGTSWRKSGLFGIMGSTCALGLTTLMVYFFLLEGYQEMQDIKQVMCTGRKDFVIGVNYQNSGIFSVTTADSATSAHVAPNLEPITRAAVRELREIANPLDTTQSIYMADFRKFEFEVGQTMWEFAEQSTDCWDSGLIQFLLPQMQQVTRVPNASSCSDMRHKCGEVGSRVLRNICSTTCGCADPRSGLYLNGPIEGCPREACRRTSVYQEALQNIQCRDPSPEELKQIPGWKKYLDQYLDHSTTLLPKFRWLFQKEYQQFLEQGCSALYITESMYAVRDNPCFPTVVHASIRPFCPITCRCDKEMQSDCPASCSISANTAN